MSMCERERESFYVYLWKRERVLMCMCERKKRERERERERVIKLGIWFISFVLGGMAKEINSVTLFTTKISYDYGLHQNSPPPIMKVLYCLQTFVCLPMYLYASVDMRYLSYVNISTTITNILWEIDIDVLLYFFTINCFSIKYENCALKGARLILVVLHSRTFKLPIYYRSIREIRGYGWN